MIRLLHTADVHLGAPLGWLPEEPRSELRRLRLDALDRLADLAGERRVDAVLIAGDFFDSPGVPDGLAGQALGRLRRIAAPVILIPGNHDHYDAVGGVYRRAFWQDHRPSNVILAATPEPIELAGGSAVVLPCPLVHRRTAHDPTRPLRDPSLVSRLPAGAVRIGLAHGSIADFSAADAPAQNCIDLSCIESASLDYLALGDWHVPRALGPRAWYAGTPEPLHFDEADAGCALLVEIDSRGAEPRVERVPVAGSVWHRHRASLASPQDLDALHTFLRNLALSDRAVRTLLRVDLAGVLPVGELARLGAVLESARATLLHVEERGDVLPEPGDAELDAIAPAGFLRDAVDELRALAQGDGEHARDALRALTLLYTLHRAEAGGPER